jgi:hypothetical protein
LHKKGYIKIIYVELKIIIPYKSYANY